jgi:hypothetical protein
MRQRTKLCLTSAGVVIAGLFVATLMSNLWTASAQVTAPLGRAESGRYQVFIRPNAAGTYLVDTQTGRVWEKTTVENASVGNNGDAPWLWQDRIDNEEQLISWMRRHKKDN